MAQHFLQHGPALQSAADLLADPTSHSFLQQALGLPQVPTAYAQAQAELISAMLNFREFQIPSRLQQFIELYLSRPQTEQAAAGPTPDPEVHGPMLPGQAAPVSESLLAHLQTLRIGG